MLELPLTKYVKRDIKPVLLLCESALNEIFLAVVQKVLGEVQASKPHMHIVDPVYITVEFSETDTRAGRADEKSCRHAMADATRLKRK